MQYTIIMSNCILIPNLSEKLYEKPVYNVLFINLTRSTQYHLPLAFAVYKRENENFRRIMYHSPSAEFCCTLFVKNRVDVLRGLRESFIYFHPCEVAQWLLILPVNRMIQTSVYLIVAVKCNGK